MKKVDVQGLIRPHLIGMKPYSSARDEYTGKSEVYLDANENALGSVTKMDLSRYPDPHQNLIKEKLSKIKSAAIDQIFIGNGSDEPIDLLIRAFCNPKQDDIIILPPTYGMYEVSANINNVLVKKVPLTSTFQIQVEEVLKGISDHTKIIFTCNPNNPTGTRILDEDILTLIKSFNGLVVVDEAYIDFSDKQSFISQISEYNNLVILQTFSKAWGMAAARVGMLFADQEVVSILNKIKPPYNVNQLSQEAVLEALGKVDHKNQMVKNILTQKIYLAQELHSLDIIEEIHPSDANFILVRVSEPKKLYQYLIEKNIIVRDRSNVLLCEGCLRITIGNEVENKRLLGAIKGY